MIRARRRARAGRGGDPPAWPGRPGWPEAGRQELRIDSACGIEAIECPGVDQRLDAAGADLLGRDPLEEVVEAQERALLLACLDDRLDGLESDPLDRSQPEVDLPLAGDPEIDCPSLILGSRTSIPIRRQSSICSTKNLSRSAPSISEESTAAMNSVG